MQINPNRLESCFKVTLLDTPRLIERRILNKGNPVDVYDGTFRTEVLESGEVLEELGARDFAYELLLSPVGGKPLSISGRNDFADHEEGSTLLFNKIGEPKEIVYVDGNKFHLPGIDPKKEVKAKIVKQNILPYGKCYQVGTIFVKTCDDEVDTWLKIVDSLRTPRMVTEFDVELPLTMMRCDLELLLQAKDLCLSEIGG